MARPMNVIAQYNEVFNNGVNNSAARGYGIWFDTVGAGSQIRYNEAFGNVFCGMNIESPSDVGVPSDVGSAGVQAEYGNVSFSNGSGVCLSRHSHGSVIANNTTWGNSYANILVQGNLPPDTIGMNDNVIANNISWNWLGGGYSLIAIYGGENDGSNGTGNVYENNGVGIAGTGFVEWGAGKFKSAYSAWETAAGNCGAVGCSHSVQADPLLSDPAQGDFTLQPGSPAIGAGVHIAGVSTGSPPNIGAK